MDLSGIQLLLDAAAVVTECDNISQYIRDPRNDAIPPPTMPSVGCFEEVCTSGLPEFPLDLSLSSPAIENADGTMLDISRDISFKNIPTSTPKKQVQNTEPLDLRFCPPVKQTSEVCYTSDREWSKDTPQDLRTKTTITDRNYRDHDQHHLSSGKSKSTSENIASDPSNNSSSAPTEVKSSRLINLRATNAYVYRSYTSFTIPSRNMKTSRAASSSFSAYIDAKSLRIERDRCASIPGLHENCLSSSISGRVKSRDILHVPQRKSSDSNKAGPSDLEVHNIPCCPRPIQQEATVAGLWNSKTKQSSLNATSNKPTRPIATDGTTSISGFQSSVANSKPPCVAAHNCGDMKSLAYQASNVSKASDPRNNFSDLSTIISSGKVDTPDSYAIQLSSSQQDHENRIQLRIGSTSTSASEPQHVEQHTEESASSQALVVTDLIPPANTARSDAKNTDKDEESEYEIDDEDQEVQIGEITLFNEFIVEEYFEKYQNLSLLVDEIEDEFGANKENEAIVNVPSSKYANENSAFTSSKPLCAKQPREGDLGFDEIDTSLIPSKKPNINKRKEAQRARTRGIAYVNSNGQLVAARSVKPPCSCTKHECFKKYDDSTRKKLLINLLKLSSSGQNQFLSNHMTIRTTARPKVLNSRRLFTRTYFLPGLNGRIRVCKDMFMATFDVRDKKLRLLAEKQLIGRGISADDLRSKNGAHKALSEEDLQHVSQHIRSFPAYTSHYSREKSSKLFLSSDLSVMRIYELYKQKCTEDNKQPVHYSTYRRVFKTMNISFRKPKMDTCGECDKFATALKLSNDDQKSEIVALRDAHHNRAQEAYRQKKADVSCAKSNERIRTASFDLQKCLATPHLTSGIAYYKRQLYTLNLTIFSTHKDNNIVDCYLWDESKARRGSQEIGSCLLKDLHGMDSAIEQVVYYSDRCSGQNHNFIICMAFQTFIEECRSSGRKMTVHHKFMTSGHSHMEVDSAHAAIEKAKK